jgi:flavin reductase (DIM6/NTAB) family NADH-FMN oxidoreductase RutF
MSKLAGTIGTGAAAFDQRDFRNALGRFATGIAVITTQGPDGKPVGLTANSFSAVSLEPPLILWCLGKSAASLPAFRDCGHFAVNILEVGQRALSHRFATPAKDKFAGLAWDAGLGGAPVFSGSLARFECRNVEQHDGGDHVIFVGRVERYSHADGSPLLFNAGKYGTAAAHPDDGVEPVESSDFADLLL